MQPRKWALAGLAAATLVACEMPVEPDDQCGARGYRGLVGQPLAAVTLPDTLAARVIGPDTAVTMDYVATRMNIWVGRDGVIQRVDCG